jgi:two-component system sensor histidine kinase HydH
MRSARWGLLLTALAASGALVLAAWSSYARVQEASRLIARGQGEALLARIRGTLAPLGRRPTSEDLGALLDEERETGLRYVLLLDFGGQVIAEAGAPAAPVDLPAVGGRGALLELPTAMRMIHVIPRPPAGLRGLHEPFDHDRGPPDPGLTEHEGPPERGSPEREGPPDRGPPDPGLLRRDGPRRGPEAAERGSPPFDGRPPPPAIIVDFEPVVTEALKAGALRTFAASGVAALGMMAAALIFWRQIGRRERDRERLERERRLAALGEMSAVLAHEIKNPLTALKGNAQLLVEQLEPGGRPYQKAERIVASAKRLEDLTGTLLDFVRSGQLAREPADPRAIIRRGADNAGDDRVELDLEGAPERFRLDPIRMEQVITNLVKNAVEASPPDAKVELRAGLEAGCLVITVRDRGPGIPAGEEEAIFEAFHTTRTRGTGLGLAVSRRILEMHGGTLEARNHPGGGAVFRLAVPE